LMAVKRGRAEPILEDVSLCVRMGWTISELRSQPARFVEFLSAYLGALEDVRSREAGRFEEDLENRLRRMRM